MAISYCCEEEEAGQAPGEAIPLCGKDVPGCRPRAVGSGIPLGARWEPAGSPPGPARGAAAYLTATRTELSSAPADMVLRARGGQAPPGAPPGRGGGGGTAADPPHLLLRLRNLLSTAILGD